LIIEKSELLRKIFSFKLAKSCSLIEFVDNIESSITEILKKKPDILIVNNVEDNYTGIGLCVLIKTSISVNKIKTVILSSQNQVVDKKLENYCDKIIKKDETIYDNILKFIDKIRNS